MPRAVVNISETKTIELKSCTGGWVKLRRMSYGQWLLRQEMSLQMQMQVTDRKSKEATADLKTAQREVTHFEFKTCIAEHNLEDENGQPLNFQNAWVVEMLDPRVGNEIGEAIAEMHNVDGDLGNSLPSSVD